MSAAVVVYLFAPVATFGENLTRLRLRAGFKTSISLADALEVVPSVVSKLENDKQGLPEGPTLLKLAKTCKCAVDELLAGVDDDYDALLKTLQPKGDTVDARPNEDERDASRDELLRLWSLLRDEEGRDLALRTIGRFARTETDARSTADQTDRQASDSLGQTTAPAKAGHRER